MLHFKEAGLECYDWGGVFADESTPERAGINQFKRMFGGQRVVHYECTVPATPRGRLWLALRERRRAWHPPRPVPALRQGDRAERFPRRAPQHAPMYDRNRHSHRRLAVG